MLSCQSLCSVLQRESQPGRDAGQQEGRRGGPRLLLRPPCCWPGGSGSLGNLPEGALCCAPVHGACHDCGCDVLAIKMTSVSKVCSPPPITASEHTLPPPVCGPARFGHGQRDGDSEVGVTAEGAARSEVDRVSLFLQGSLSCSPGAGLYLPAQPQHGRFR